MQSTLIVLAQEPLAREYLQRLHQSGFARGIANLRDIHLFVPVNEAWIDFPDSLAQNPFKMNSVFTENTRSPDTNPRDFMAIVVKEGPLTDANVKIWQTSLVEVPNLITPLLAGAIKKRSKPIQSHKRKRCPNGSRKSPKTGVCEKKSETKTRAEAKAKAKPAKAKKAEERPRANRSKTKSSPRRSLLKTEPKEINPNFAIKSLLAMPDRSLLSKTEQTNFKSLLTKESCHKVLGSGSTGKATKVCLSDSCDICQVVKYAANEKEGGVAIGEADILREVTEKVPDMDPYSVFLQRQVKSFLAEPIYEKAPQETEAWIISKAVDVDPTFGNLYKQIQDPSASLQQLALFSFEIFATLAHVRSKVDGFLHLDLKSDNVALARENPAVTRTLLGKTIRGQTLRAVLIDFGLAESKATPQSWIGEPRSTFGPACIEMGFDVMTWMTSLVRMSKNKKISQGVQQWGDELFLGLNQHFGELIYNEKLFSQNFYRPIAKGCEVFRGSLAKEFKDANWPTYLQAAQFFATKF